MTYYSCSPLLTIQGRYKTCPYKNGPRGIRTLDLLNAIETRSQTALWAHLSYQFPVIRDQRMLATDNRLLITTCGPGGIRTRDLFSAIEARSQLRYRPGQRIAFYLLCAALSSKCRRSCARRQFGADFRHAVQKQDRQLLRGCPVISKTCARLAFTTLERPESAIQDFI